MLLPETPAVDPAERLGESIPETRLLLVDDDEDIAFLVRALLADNDIHVDWASDHDAAIEAIRHDAYVALLIDYHLGPSNGVRLMEELLVRGYDAPMLMLTGSIDPSVDAAALSAGAANYLSKDDLTGVGLGRAIRYARERHMHLSRARRLAESLRHEASTDPMTQLGNRRAFDQDIASLVDEPGPGGLLMIDLDGLKGINDGLGHVAGDHAIRTIADRIRATIRAEDAAYRIGGDEMAVVTRAPGLQLFRRRLAAMLRRVPGPDGAVSASVGWADRESTDTVAGLMGRADRRLYRAKALRHQANPGSVAH